jgi:PIN domain nuclease of toxin-antitoxin system
VRVLLDTVTFVWAISAPERLSRAALAALRKDTAIREVSVVSLTEIAVKRMRGKLTFDRTDVVAGATDLGVRLLPFTAEHALHLFDLATHHPDPFDRQLISQALVEGIPVVTPDEAFALYDGLKVVW